MNRPAKALASSGRRTANSKPSHPQVRAPLFAIGELAREFGLTTRTIRFYETRGLITPQRNGASRTFGNSDRDRLRLILRSKNLGLSLDEIAEQLALFDALAAGEPYPPELSSRIERAIEALATKQAALTQTVRDLRCLRSALQAHRPSKPRPI